MAGTKSAENAVQTRPVEVSQKLQDGEKFIKWDEVRILNFGMLTDMHSYFYMS